MRTSIKSIIKKNISRILVFVMLLSLVCPAFSEWTPRVRAADATISTGGVILITESGNYVIDGTGKEIYSITVSGDIDVKLYLYNVKIDGRDWTYEGYTGEGSTTSYWLNGTETKCNNASHALYEAGMQLGWTNGTNKYYVPTCPLLVTNGATATVEMNGNNEFRAGVSQITVSKSGSNYTIDSNHSRQLSWTGFKNYLNGCGYAGIQVDPGASLSIKTSLGSTTSAYGGWQFEGVALNRNDDGDAYAFPKITVGGTSYEPKTSNSASNSTGGAGIGGGARYNKGSFSNSDNPSLTYGASGNLTISGDGTINAYGGHQAAGIGGACNSPAAATGAAITINSSTVNVQGGRWAAGIGDGDTYKNGINSDYYVENVGDDNKYTVNINGGTLNVTGGVASAGIGTSDNISHGEGAGTNAFSRMEINILGGDLTVRSGFPDIGSNSNYSKIDTTLTAAIGAGSGTNMRPNSITVGADVRLDAASFSDYAINNYGTTANSDTVPVVNLDSASHLFLCNFSTYPSNTNRTISLYPAKYAMIYEYVDETYNQLEKCELYNYDANGTQRNLVQITSTESGTPVTGFTFVEIHNVNGQELYVLSDPSEIYPYNVEIGGKDYYCKTKNETVAANGIPADKVSYSKDTSGGAIDSYNVPDYFKAIAVTLPTYDPSNNVTGGHYVVDIPLTGVSADKLPAGMTSGSTISSGVTSIEQGVISGKIEYPTKHNITLDPVTGDLSGIKVFAGNTASGTDYLGLAPGETPLYSYAVYLPAGTTQATMQIMYDRNFTVQYTQPTAATMSGSGASYTVTGLSAGSPETVRIRVQETVNGTKLSAVTYVVTLYVREQYTMEITAPATKVYDGASYKILPSDVVIRDKNSNIVTLTDELFEQIEFIYSQTDTKNVGDYNVTASIYPQREPWQASAEHSFSVTPRPLKITGVQKWMQYLEKNSDASSKGPFEIGEIYFTGAVAGDNVVITVLNGKAYSVYNINEQNDKNGENYLRLENPQANNPNYTVQLTGGTYVDVMCRIYYDMRGAIFRNDGIGNEHVWDKFFPVDSELPLDFSDPSVTDNYQHAGGSHTHTESVFFHSVNNGETQKIYCVDVEFGSLDFTFTKRVWNVSTLDYDDTNGVWVGFDGVQNRITVKNYSNAPVYIDMLASVISGEAQQLLGQKGLGVKLDSVNGNVKDYQSAFTAANPTSLFPSEDTVEFSVAPATPKTGSTAGSPGTDSYYVFMLNSPKFGENAGAQITANITLTISQTP